MLKLPAPSPEQQVVIQALEKSHVTTCSVPGSGKTTLALNVMLHFRKAQGLIVTYNRVLCDDLRAKVDVLKLGDRVKCYTYHALLGFLCEAVCMNDDQFLNLLETKLVEVDVREKIDFDLLVVDEMQDMRPHHYRLLFEMLRSNYQIPRRLLFIGDPNQLLYDFYKQNPADQRYLTFADQLFAPFKANCDFQRHDLSVSFRLTPHLASFMNHLFPSRPMVGGNTQVPNQPVKIIVGNLFSQYCRMIQYVRATLNEQPMHETMFLASSVTHSKPLQIMTDKLSRQGVRFLVTHSRFRQDKSREMQKNKVLVTTFCGAKGLERPRVFVFGLGYELNRDKPRLNQLYVALTRSCGGELYVLCHYTQSMEWLRGMDPNCYEIIELRQQRTFRKKRPVEKTPCHTTPIHLNVPSLLAFTDAECLREARRMFTVRKCLSICAETSSCAEELVRDWSASDGDSEEDENDYAPDMGDAVETEGEENCGGLVRFGTVIEDTNHLMRAALPMMMEFELHGRCARLEKMLRQMSQADVSAKYRQLDSKNHSLEQWLEFANVVSCQEAGYSYMLKQIDSYDWVRQVESNLDSHRRFFRTLPPLDFNVSLLFRLQADDDDVVLHGECDAIATDRITLFSFIYNSEIDSDSILLCAIKLKILEENGEPTRRALLYNFKDSSTWEIKLLPSSKNKSSKNDLLQLLIQYRRCEPKKRTDDDFLRTSIGQYRHLKFLAKQTTM